MILNNCSNKQIELIEADVNFTKSKKYFMELFRELTKDKFSTFIVNFSNDTIYQDSNFENICICKDNSKISDIRLDFFGSDVEEYKVKDKNDLDFINDVCDNCYYDSNKSLKSKNKIYKSKAAWKAQQSSEELTPVIDSPEYWEEF